MLKGKDFKSNSVKITLDIERELSFDLNAFCELEEVYNGDVFKAFDDMERGSMIALRALLYCGLKNDDETLTIKEVGSLIQLNDMHTLSDAVAKALSNAMPKPETNAVQEKK